MQLLCSFKLHFVACVRQKGGTSCKTASCIVTTTTKQAGKRIKFLPASIMFNSLIDTNFHCQNAQASETAKPFHHYHRFVATNHKVL